MQGAIKAITLIRTTGRMKDNGQRQRQLSKAVMKDETRGIKAGKTVRSDPQFMMFFKFLVNNLFFFMLSSL